MYGELPANGFGIDKAGCLSDMVLLQALLHHIFILHKMCMDGICQNPHSVWNTIFSCSGTSIYDRFNVNKVSIDSFALYGYQAIDIFSVCGYK